jgi:hypothetical protein
MTGSPLDLLAKEGEENNEAYVCACTFAYRVDVGSSLADINSAGLEDYANLRQCQKRTAAG